MRTDRLSERDLKALFALGIVVMFALAYFLGYHLFLEETNAIQLENSKLEVRLTNLQQKEREKQTTIEKTEEYNQKIDAIVAKYPSKVTTEKVIYDLDAIQSQLGKLQYNAVTLEMNRLFYPATESTTSEETKETGQEMSTGTTSQGYADGKVTVFKSKVTAHVENLSYTALKTLMDEVNQYNGRLTVESMNVMYSKESGLLEGEIVFNFYALEGSTTEYQVPDISGVSSGLTNIFGTFDQKLVGKTEENSAQKLAGKPEENSTHKSGSKSK